MENSVFNSNIRLATFYYNGGNNPSVQDSHWCHPLWIEGSAGSNQPSTELQRHTKGGQCWVLTSIDQLSRSVRFIQMKLMNDDVRTMFAIFGEYSTRGSIELDASLVRSVEQIHKSLIRLRNYKEIMALLDAPDKDNSLDDLRSTMFYFIMCFMSFLLRVLCCRIMFYL